MHCLKRIMLAGLFIVPVLFAQSAWAAIGFLPDSSHYQGRSYSNSDPEDRVRVDFAVYDTLGGNEFAGAGFAAPGDGRFTYVYQVFNDLESSDSIYLFRIFEIDLSALEGADISSEDDLAGGIITDYQRFNLSSTNGIWEFEQGLLIEGEHSWFLTLSSDNDYIAGNFSINDPDDEVPIPSIPEPATMILLGIGSLILMAKKKGSAGISR